MGYNDGHDSVLTHPYIGDTVGDTDVVLNDIDVVDESVEESFPARLA